MKLTDKCVRPGRGYGVTAIVELKEHGWFHRAGSQCQQRREVMDLHPAGVASAYQHAVWAQQIPRPLQHNSTLLIFILDQWKPYPTQQQC